MSDDVAGGLSVLVAFVAGFWNGWVWRYLVARRRLATFKAEEEHRLHHVWPHPHGGTFPYAKPICECDQYDGCESAP